MLSNWLNKNLDLYRNKQENSFVLTNTAQRIG